MTQRRVATSRARGKYNSLSGTARTNNQLQVDTFDYWLVPVYCAVRAAASVAIL